MASRKKYSSQVQNLWLPKVTKPFIFSFYSKEANRETASKAKQALKRGGAEQESLHVGGLPL